METAAPGEPFIVREVTLSDAQAVAGLSAELGYPVAVPAMRDRIERIFLLRDHAIFVACRADLVLGWIHVSTVEHLQDEPRAEIGGLVVTTEARSAGVGAKLVVRAEQWAQEQGFAKIVVRSQIAREAAHRFYLRQGYTRTKTSAVFTKILKEG